MAAAVALARPGGAAAVQTISDAIMRRIGVTTVCLRDWFPATRGNRPQPAGGDLSLLTAPKFIADQLTNA